MKDTDSGKHAWAKEMIQLLEELSSDYLHQEGWLKGTTTHVYTWSDFAVEVLDVHLNDYFLTEGIRRMGFSDSVRESLQLLRDKLHALVETYGVDDSRVKDLIQDRRFLHIMSHGVETLEAFRVESHKLGLVSRWGANPNWGGEAERR